METGTETKDKTYSLYPYQSIQLVVVFVYGLDYQRELDLFAGIPSSVQLGAALIVSFISIAAIALYVIRRKYRLSRSNFSSTFFDCWIPFIGGGNLRMRHKYERLFFGILLFGAFFIMSVFAGDLLDSLLRVRNQKINTFEKLKERNSPIYLNPTFGIYSDTIQSMLKLVNVNANTVLVLL